MIKLDVQTINTGNGPLDRWCREVANTIRNINTFTAAGDLTGTSTSQTVSKIQGVPIVATGATTGQALIFNGVSYVPMNVTGGGIPSIIVPPAIASAGSIGIGTNYAREDHTHAHGNQSNGAQHTVATTLLDGFMSAADKVKLDGIKSPPADDANTVARWIEDEEPIAANFDWSTGTSVYTNRVSGGTSATLVTNGTVNTYASTFGGTKRAANFRDQGQGLIGGQAIALPSAFTISFFLELRLPRITNAGIGNAILFSRTNAAVGGGFSASQFDLYFSTQTLSGSQPNPSENSVNTTAFLRTSVSTYPVTASFGASPLDSGGMLPYFIRSHVAMTFGSNVFRVFVNGVAVGSIATAGTVPANTANHRWAVGCPGGTTYTQPMSIERIVVSNIVRTPGEIRAEAFSGLGG